MRLAELEPEVKKKILTTSNSVGFLTKIQKLDCRISWSRIDSGMSFDSFINALPRVFMLYVFERKGHLDTPAHFEISADFMIGGRGEEVTHMIFIRLEKEVFEKEVSVFLRDVDWRLYNGLKQFKT